MNTVLVIFLVFYYFMTGIFGRAFYRMEIPKLWVLGMAVFWPLTLVAIYLYAYAMSRGSEPDLLADKEDK